MSFVVGFATDKYGIIMSDGRCRDYNDNIITENYNKTKKIGRTIIGFAGETVPCEMAVNSLKLHPLATVSEVSLALVSFLRNLKLPSTRKCNFVIIGPNIHNQMEVHSFGTATDLVISKQLPTSQKYGLVTLSSDLIDNGNQVVSKQFTKPHKTVKDVLKDAICEVAAQDPSVNTNCFHQEISLESLVTTLF